MNPAPSIILFSVLSGLGFGFLAMLGPGILHVAGHGALAAWGIGYALAVGGLLASTFHLGRPERAWRAFSQWRSSWLSREGIAACAALVILAPMALSDWMHLGLPRIFGWLGAVLALGTVFTTSMIYTQLKTVPRWNHWITPVTFLTFAIAGGSLLAGKGLWASLLCLILAGVLLAGWRIGDGRFVEAGQTIGTATGLDRIGQASVFEHPHTGGNYLMREMIHVVGRKHARKLRLIALLCAALLPALIVALLDPVWAAAPAVLLHLLGAFAQRWLFFAEAEHVVGLYYGAR